jgi:hypothetical protein
MAAEAASGVGFMRRAISELSLAFKFRGMVIIAIGTALLLVTMTYVSWDRPQCLR